MPAWLAFALSAAVVVAAGQQLASAGDTIAERTGLGRAWVGAILVAGATSLPELTTDLFAVRQGTPDLAIGDLFGSCMANMLILAVADLSLTRVRVLTRVAINQAIVGTLAVTLIAVAIAGALTAGELHVFGVGWSTPAILFGYASGMRLIHVNRGGPPFMSEAAALEAERGGSGLRAAVARFLIAALVILVAGRELAAASADVARQLGITAGLMGFALLALATSLPEVAVTVSSLRTGAYDLAVGNLLGSNAFNIVILALLDLADDGSVLLTHAGPGELAGGMFAAFLIGQTLLDLLNRSQRHVWYLEPGAILRVLTWLLGMLLVWQASG